MTESDSNGLEWTPASHIMVTVPYLKKLGAPQAIDKIVAMSRWAPIFYAQPGILKLLVSERGLLALCKRPHKNVFWVSIQNHPATHDIALGKRALGLGFFAPEFP